MTTGRTSLALRQPTMAVMSSPLDRLRPRDMTEVLVGRSIRSLKPDTKSRQLRCFVNGLPLYPITAAQWKRHLKLLRSGDKEKARRQLARAVRAEKNWELVLTQPGDIITWHEVVGDKDVLRTVLQIAVLVAAIYTGGSTGAFIGIFGSFAIAILLPPSTPAQNDQEQGGTIYSTSLTGNQARLDQPIQRNCGVNKMNPPYACQPYYKYISSSPDGLDADQYLHVVFVLGIGRNEILRAFIGQTPLEQLSDITTYTHLRAGEQPANVLCNIETCEQVQGIDLDSDGRYGGPFVACKPHRKCSKIEIDMGAPQGLGTSSGPMEVTWRVECAEVDDQGRLIGAWNILAPESETAETNTPQRWTKTYTLPTPIRPMVRVVRTDIKNTAPDARAALAWIGLKGYLTTPAPLNPHAEHLEIVIRANEQLSAQSQRDFSVLIQGLTRTWTPDAGFNCALGDYPNYVASRNPAWSLADLWLDPVWGEGHAENRVDLLSIYEMSLLWEQRQDRFDYVFDQTMNAWDAAQLIAASGRARCFRRLGIFTLSRDELELLPTTGYSPRNTVAGSMKVTENLPNRQTPDGIRLEYTSNVTWDIDTIECPAPGFTVSDETDPRYNGTLPKMQNPTYVRVNGIKGAKHAEREGLYQAAASLLRTRSFSLTAGMEGQVPAVLTPIRWQPEIQGFSQSGDVVAWDVGTLTMTLTEPAHFAVDDSSMLVLVRDDGTLTTAVVVLPGPTAYDVVLPAAPDFELIVDSGTRERPRFFLGNADAMGKIVEVTDGGKAAAGDGELGQQLFNIEGFLDDPRVHAADNHLLPGPGDIQDPIDDGSDSTPPPGSGSALIVRMLNHFGRSLYGVDAAVTYELRNDGSAHLFDGYGVNLELPNEWLQYNPVEAVDAGVFEVRFTFLGGYGNQPTIGEAIGVLNPFTNVSDYLDWDPGVPAAPTGGDTLDTWLSLSTNRSVVLAQAGHDTNGVISAVRVEVRVASSGAIQATRVITLAAQQSPSGNGNIGGGG